jgi:phospholipase/carboxylesterase
MGHGRSDPVIPLARGIASRDVLAAAGYEVEWHEYEMQHSVCEEEIQHIAAFLTRVLGKR